MYDTDGPHNPQDSAAEGDLRESSRHRPTEEFTPLVLHFLPSSITADSKH